MKLFDIVIYLLIIEISLCSTVKYLTKEDKISDAKEFEKKIREKQSECWKNAVLNINGSCKSIDVNEQRLLAVKFTQCHMDAVGRKLPDYTVDTNFKLYNTKYLKDDAFNAYTAFFIHVDNLCFYLQNEIWCESTDKTIDELNTNTDTMKHSLDILLENEYQLVSNQNISLKHHQMIIENEILLIAESEKAKNMISNMQTEVNQSFSTLDNIMLKNNRTVTDFVSIIGRYLTKIEFLQRYLVNGIFDLESIFYYVLVIFISLFLTSPVSVRKARPTIFVSIFINVMLERYILNLLIDTIYENDIINYRSILRSMLLIVIVIEFISHLLTYNDLDEKSYVVLIDLNKKLSTTKQENVKEEEEDKQKENENEKNDNSYIHKCFKFIPVFMNNIRERFSSNSSIENSINEITEENDNNKENSAKPAKVIYKTPSRKKRGRSSAPGTLQSTAKVNGSGSGNRGRSKRRRTDSTSCRKRIRSSSRSVSRNSRRSSFDSIAGDEEDIFPAKKYETPYNIPRKMFTRTSSME